MSPQEIAKRCAAIMWADDKASKWLGMELAEVGPGTAALSLNVTENMANGHGICHGGLIFALADSAFAFACNSFNQCAVAQHNSISYLAPARVGDKLRAEAQEVGRSGRTGLYDVRVVNQDGVSIAEFRGASRVIEGQHFDPEDAQ